MLSIEIDARDLERARFIVARYPERLRAAMYKANANSSAVLTKRIKDNITSTFHQAGSTSVKTMNLRRNWAAIMPRVAEGENAWVGGAGSGRTEYARYHEFGFSGSVNVRAHARRGDTAWGRKVTPFVAQVSAHARSVNYRGRPYARPALTEVRPRIEAIHSDQVRQAWEKSQ